MNPTIVTIHTSFVSPQTVTIQVGETVQWFNKTRLNSYSVIFDDKSVGDSGNIPPQGTFDKVFNTVGTFPYSCGNTSEMSGTVNVV